MYHCDTSMEHHDEAVDNFDIIMEVLMGKGTIVVEQRNIILEQWSNVMGEWTTEMQN